MNYLRFSQTKNGNYPVVCAREGGANTTPFQVAYFALRNTKNKTTPKKSPNRAKPKKQKGKKPAYQQDRENLSILVYRSPATKCEINSVEANKKIATELPPYRNIRESSKPPHIKCIINCYSIQKS